jgi:hypothetical protein
LPARARVGTTARCASWRDVDELDKDGNPTRHEQGAADTLPDWAVGLPLASEEQACAWYTKSKAALTGIKT